KRVLPVTHHVYVPPLALVTLLPRPPIPPLFPYTTLFRSLTAAVTGAERARILEAVAEGEVDLVIGAHALAQGGVGPDDQGNLALDRKSTRLNSSHVAISYAGFCLKKKKPHLIRDKVYTVD